MRVVFDRIIVEGREVESITPNATCEPLFVLDGRERFNDEMG